jgi:DNA helicase-2/ATP-dependent DNA helicase PcrA
MEIKRPIPFEQELNPQQLQVVKSGSGPILVIAGAGSGKTRALTYRVAYLIESGNDPHRILLLTFTNKAAREMINRVEALVPCDAKKIWGGTFHHIANRILRVHGQRLGFDPNYTILDQSDAYGLLDSCLRDLGHKRKDSVIPQGAVLFRIISLSRNTRTGLGEILERRYSFFLDYIDEIKAIEHHYKEKKKKLNLLDFDDLLCMWLSLMEEDPGLRDYYSQRFEYILVDEYQDTNKLQADIIDILASHHRNVMVVGDDSQSIYAFRGANFLNIMDFPKRYPDARMYKLEYNYRSSPEILNLANEVIACNENQYRKVLQPVKGDGMQPYLIAPANVHQQAQFVADKIHEFLYNGVVPGEIAVLYRAHFHSMELQMELSRRTIPFEVRSGIRFFEQAHIKDIISYLKVIINPYDEVAWKRILQLLPGIGEKTSQKIFNHLSTSGAPLTVCNEQNIVSLVPKGARPYWNNLDEIISSLTQIGTDSSPAALIKASFEGGYRDYMRSKYTDSTGRSEDIEQFIEFSWQYESLGDFLTELALMTSNAPEEIQDEHSREKIKLSTIHQAKGLEWSVVFILWLSEGRFPNPNNLETLEDEEEERRLFYVSVTRAKDQLYLCAPVCLRDGNGYTTVLKPSRFLREIPEDCYIKLDAIDEYGSYY